MSADRDTDERTLLPIFPLPAAHLFPGGLLPLHVFEPRYREMVADAVEGERRIVMAVFRPGWETNYEGRPPIYAMAGLGEMVRVERLPDGRWSLLLHGISRVHVDLENDDRAYRRALVTQVPPSSLPASELELAPRLVDSLEHLLDGKHFELPEPLSADQLVDFVAMQLPIPPAAKQRVFETIDPSERARLVLSHLEELAWMRRLSRDPSGDSPSPDWN